MCGIAGICALDRSLGQEGAALAGRMLSTLSHRGPDGRGILSDERCILGNTRLRVIDLSQGADLPMQDEKGEVRFAYNGQVGNFVDLRERFRLGERHRFRSSSDSEVLLAMYKEFGLDFLNHLSGMFAMAIYDRRVSKAYLIRDPFGLRPFFYAVRGGRLYFASEIKALLEVPGLGERLDRQAFWHYFSLAYIPGARTPWEDIRELEGGKLVEIDLRSGAWKERPYHELRYARDSSISFGEAAASLRGMMREALSRNLVSDVPVGIAFSGGVDTSGLLALAKEAGRSESLHTFSVSIDEPSFDESRWQKLMVEFAKPVHHEVRVSPEDFAENLEACLAYQDEPSGDGAAIPFFLLAKEAKKHVSVLLSGEGGDEVFSAYETHRVFDAYRLYRRLPGLLRGLARALSSRLPVSHKKLSFEFLLKRFTEGAEAEPPEAHLYWRHACSPRDKAAVWRGKDGLASTERLFSEMFGVLDFEEELARIAAIDMRYYFVGDLMLKNDRMLMAHSIEGRYPYMERDLVEFACRLPMRWKVRGLKGRLIQKEALKGIVPAAILDRSNMGLEMPYSKWLAGPLRPLAEKWLSRESVERTGLLDHGAVMRLWAEHLSRRKDHGRALWTIINFLAWFGIFVAEKSYKRHWSAAEAA